VKAPSRVGDTIHVEIKVLEVRAAKTGRRGLVRKRTVGALWDRIGLAIDAFTPAECANYFVAAGYDPE
jgi:hypothetical protein